MKRRTCDTCRHFLDFPHNQCLRYPKPVHTYGHYVCGEYQWRPTAWAAAWSVVALILWLAWLLGAFG